MFEVYRSHKIRHTRVR